MDSRHAVDEVVSFEKGSSDEFREVVVKVGPGGVRAQRFTGRLLGESTQFTRVGVEQVRVYLSRKGKYAVHKQTTDWTDFSVMTDWVKDLKKDWRNGFDLDDQSWGDSTLQVLDSVEELRDRVPLKIYRTLVDVTEHPPIEDLDI